MSFSAPLALLLRHRFTRRNSRRAGSSSGAENSHATRVVYEEFIRATPSSGVLDIAVDELAATSGCGRGSVLAALRHFVDLGIVARGGRLNTTFRWNMVRVEELVDELGAVPETGPASNRTVFDHRLAFQAFGSLSRIGQHLAYCLAAATSAESVTIDVRVEDLCRYTKWTVGTVNKGLRELVREGVVSRYVSPGGKVGTLFTWQVIRLRELAGSTEDVAMPGPIPEAGPTRNT